MTLIPALHICFEGLTSSFRHPLTISGTQLSTPMPSYSNLLGTCSACAGRIIGPKDTRIGFEFHCQSQDVELERTVRWMVKRGQLKPQTKGQGLIRRQVYWSPVLDLYLTNCNLKSAFDKPVATPCMGRSQDISWITLVREIQLVPVEKGALGPTLIPAAHPGTVGLIVRLPEWMENTKIGYTRQPGPFGVYHAMVPTTKLRFEIKATNLYHPSDSVEDNAVIYLHEWIKDKDA